MKSNRRRAHIAYVGPSRTAGFYVLAVDDEDRSAIFIYGKHFMNLGAIIPRKGWQIEFTPLPRGVGRYKRGTEVSIVRAQNKNRTQHRGVAS